ncbi:hypothetical protein ACFFQF_28330 [Haladaptatus pallidirubidus]|uniref:Uncharacterized protein n=1 Tax=Haladaptatus pallidirubidus TaxID=1008152 RepID=A0AAV3UJF1_9EURY|nr:hypothetical protein [Haladaptatus pallidirubidus]
MHEKRYGDRPAVGRSVRAPYYGTVDATPLFADTVHRTGNDALCKELYPHVKAAIEWTLDELDDNGYLFYRSHDHPLGLEHLGGKDSTEALLARTERLRRVRSRSPKYKGTFTARSNSSHRW